MMDNPYSSPKAKLESSVPVPSQESAPSLGSIAKGVFLSWERLRIVYVVVLGILTLLLAASRFTEARTFWVIIKGAIVANICFFAGPVLETYVRWLGYNRTWVRWLLFGGGTLLTAIGAAVALIWGFGPNQG